MTLTLEQLEARRQGIGGSDAAAIFDSSRYASSFDIYNDKTGEIPRIYKRDSEEKKKKEDQNRGHTVESILAKRYQKETNSELILYKDIMPLKHEKIRYVLANIDGLDKANGVIFEAKTVNPWAPIIKELGEENSDQIPIEWLFQVAHYAKVLEHLKIKEVHIKVAIVCDNERPTETIEKVLNYIYKPNEQFQNELITKYDYFWNKNVIPRIPPQVESKRKNVIPADKIKIADDTILSTYTEACYLQEAISKLETELKDKKKVLKDYQDEYEYLVDQNFNKLSRNYVQIRECKPQEAKTLYVPMFTLMKPKNNERSIRNA